MVLFFLFQQFSASLYTKLGHCSEHFMFCYIHEYESQLSVIYDYQ